MDDSLLADFQSTFTVAGDVHSPRSPHPHYAGLYKQHKEGYTSQEVRRKQMLDNQKTKRRDLVDYARRIVEGETGEDSEGLEMDEGEGFDEVDSTEQASKDSIEKKQKKKRFYPYSNQLMLSEWLVEVPGDFADKWLMFVCPIAKRCLVIAAKGTTYAYGRDGRCINNFPSLLPGGSAKTFRRSVNYCILDCLYYAGTRTFYVLDIMCWGGHPVYDSDTEFRTFWKASKLRDNAHKISKCSAINPLIFIDLPGYPCTKDSITQVLSQKWPVQVDGLLFVHREAHYWPRRNPLAVWLKAHMVPDIIGLPVSQEFLSCAPVLSEVKMDCVSRKSGKSKKIDESQQSMDVATSLTDNAGECLKQSEN